jgi:hypothetical protein
MKKYDHAERYLLSDTSDKTSRYDRLSSAFCIFGYRNTSEGGYEEPMLQCLAHQRKTISQFFAWWSMPSCTTGTRFSIRANAVIAAMGPLELVTAPEFG